MSSIEKTLLEETQVQLDQLHIRKGDSLCVGFSGGPDSTALLLLLNSLRGKIGFFLHVVYMEHGIRDKGEREGEMRHVVLTVNRMGLPLYTKCLPAGLLVEESAFHGGLEAAARNRRFQFFEKIRQCTGSLTVALAHTQDDQVETLLMRVFQGAGVEGLTGMKTLEGTVFRPLLETKKERILELLSLKNISYSVDSTNDSTDYLRNSIRRRIVPAVLQTFPSLNTSLEQLSLKMRSVMEALEYNSPKLSFPVTGEKTVRYDHRKFFDLPMYYRMQLIYRLHNRWYPEERERLPYGFLLELCGRASTDDNHIYGSGHGLKMEKFGRELFWSRVIVPERKKRYLSLVQPGVRRIGNSLRCRVFNENTGSGTTGVSPYDNFEDGDFAHRGFKVFTGPEYLPCVFRSRRDGDSILLISGHKRIKSLLNDIGIPKDGGYQVVILEDRRGILAVALMKGIFFRVFLGKYAVENRPGAIEFTFEFE